MNVIIDARLLTRGGTSGIEEYTRSLVSEILNSDLANRYSIFYNGVNKVGLPAQWAERAEIINKNIPNKLLDLSSRFLGRPKLESFVDGDLIFSPHFNILATNLPRIITFHDLSFVHHPDFFARRQKIWHWLQNIKRQAEEASKIIAVSEFTKSDLVEIFKIPPEKIKVIYSGIDQSFKILEKDDTGLTDFKKRNNLEKPFILYLGTIEPRKNVPAIIRAFNILKKDKQFDGLELILAGGAGWLYGETLQEAKDSEFSSDIRFIGGIASEERVCLYNLAKVFIYPSFFEGFGFPPLEAQACGVPVIASNRTSLPEILGNSAILVEPWRIDQICEGARRILSNETIKDSLRRAGLANAARFSWKRAAAETVKLYN